MKRSSPSESAYPDSDTVFEEYSAAKKIPKMVDAQQEPKQTYWERAWHALDFDDERATIEAIQTVEKLNEAVVGKMGAKKRAAMDAKIQEIMETVEFPSVQDPTYNGFHLPDPLTRDGVKGLMDALRKNQTLHPVYAMRLIVGARKLLKEQEHAMNEVTAPVGGTVVVVGDTHGQLTDLLTIFKLVGNPSKKRIYVFNGDFVDRGPHDVSLLLILLAWKVLLPKSVFLNRGNHEQRRMNERYSFEKHCRETYKSCVVYELIQRMFLSLPLSTLINEKVLVLHGGLSALPDVTLDDLRKLPREEYEAMKAASADASNSASSSSSAKHEPSRAETIRQDLLWSDPREEEGWADSSRGAGILFGPDVTLNFVKRNSLELIIRSHEMVDEGFQYWHKNKMVTLFSASNYCGKNENRGAVAIFDHVESPSGNVRDCIGKPYFQQYYAEVFLDEQETADISAKNYRKSCRKETLQKLRERIFQGRHQLSLEFARLDEAHTGCVSELDWAQAMGAVLKIPVDWLTLRPYLAELEAIEDTTNTEAESGDSGSSGSGNASGSSKDASHSASSSSSSSSPSPDGVETDPSKRQIKYMKFLDRFKVKVDKKFWATWEQAIIEKICAKFAEHSSSLRAAFKSIDTNGNQIIEYNEFVEVFSKLDIGLSKEQIFDFMRSIDANRDGHVDYEEFANTFQQQFRSAKDAAKNQDEIDWLKKQIEVIADVIDKSKPSLRAHFKKADTTGDGGLTYEEFADALRDQLHLKYSDEDALKLARVVDVNGSKRISWKEFKAKFTKTSNDPDILLVSVLGSVSDAIHRSKTALRTLFYQMDLDGSGKIDIEELRTGLEALNVLLAHPLTEDQLKMLHQHIDKDNDGFISYEEFLDSFSIVDTAEPRKKSGTKKDSSKKKEEDKKEDKKVEKKEEKKEDKKEEKKDDKKDDKSEKKEEKSEKSEKSDKSDKKSESSHSSASHSHHKGEDKEKKSESSHHKTEKKEKHQDDGKMDVDAPEEKSKDAKKSDDKEGKKEVKEEKKDKKEVKDKKEEDDEEKKKSPRKHADSKMDTDDDQHKEKKKVHHDDDEAEKKTKKKDDGKEEEKAKSPRKHADSKMDTDDDHHKEKKKVHHDDDDVEKKKKKKDDGKEEEKESTEKKHSKKSDDASDAKKSSSRSEESKESKSPRKKDEKEKDEKEKH